MFKVLFKAGRHANTGQIPDGVQQKRLKMAKQKYFDQLLGARPTRKLVKIHNIKGF